MCDRSSDKPDRCNKVAPGFKLHDAADGLSVYVNARDYVVAVDLAAGGELGMSNGEKIGAGGKSAYGGPSPELRRMTAQEALDAAARKTGAKVACVVNGAFFSTLNDAAAPVAFPLKENGMTVSQGFAPLSRHPGHRFTLAFNESYARMLPFKNTSIASFQQIKESSAIVSLSPKVDIDGKKDQKIGRTFVGLAGRNEEGGYTRVLFFVSPASTQLNAEKTLQRFGAGTTLMLDGGGSSQLLCRNARGSGYLVRSSRKVPQFLTMTPAFGED